MNNNIVEDTIKFQKKLIYVSLALIYNFLIGFFSFLIFVLLSLSVVVLDCKNLFDFIVIFIFTLLLVPLNILFKLKSATNVILYFILNLFVYGLGFLAYIIIV